MKVYLVGFMGAGKTTVGREVAARIGAPFFDLDELIEASEALSVAEIFSSRGEAYFRQREREILRSTRYLDRGVIATGGGTFTFDENIQFIQSVGISIYLSAPYALVRSRVTGKGDRPLFRDDVSAHELYATRTRFYRLADVTLDVREEDTPSELAERIILELPREVRESIFRPDAGRRV